MKYVETNKNVVEVTYQMLHEPVDVQSLRGYKIDFVIVPVRLRDKFVGSLLQEKLTERLAMYGKIIYKQYPNNVIIVDDLNTTLSPKNIEDMEEFRKTWMEHNRFPNGPIISVIEPIYKDTNEQTKLESDNTSGNDSQG